MEVLRLVIISQESEAVLNFKLAIVFAVVAMLAGFFIRPAIIPYKTVSPPTQDTEIIHGPVKPDTVIVDHYVTKKVPIYVFKSDTTIIIDTVFVEKQMPVYRSYDFFTDSTGYYTSQIYAWAHCPVDSFYNKVTIDYERYFYDVYGNKLNTEINKGRWSNLLKGCLAGFAVGTAAVLLTK
jgi:hypothetical protein